MDAKPQSAIETPLRKREEALGASFATWFGCTLPQQFSTLENEYRFARATAALVDKNYRAFLYLTGPDRERYLNAILTNDVRDAASRRGVPSLLLNPQGHILAELEVYSLGDRHLVVSYQMFRERLIEALDRYIIMDDVAIEDATDMLAVIGVEGLKSADVLRAAGGGELESFAELEHREGSVAGIPVRIVRRSLGGVPGFECIVERASVESLWDALLDAVRAVGGGPIGYNALNTLRLEAGIPWFGYDFDENVIPHEARLETTHISFSKGCYTGQEIVERVRSRGHVNRVRAGLEFSGSAIPDRGAKLTADGKEVGHVTSAGFSRALGHGIGMGYLRREHAAPGSVLQCAGASATVIELPLHTT
jgi:folate-binding protein YgfZ